MFFAFHGQTSEWASPVGKHKPQLLVWLATAPLDEDDVGGDGGESQGFAFDRVAVRCDPDNEEHLVSMAKLSSLERHSFKLSDQPEADPQPDSNTQSHTATATAANGNDDDDGGGGDEGVLELTPPRVRSSRLCFWCACIPLNEDRDQTHYVFKFIQGRRQWWLDARGELVPRLPGKEYHFRYNQSCKPPSWVASQVFYQIFPDRFCNGDPSISVKEGEYLYLGHPVHAREWGQPVTDTDEARCSEFYGGDLIGVRNRLSYLCDELGVTALYLNPVFTSLSNHKYDTVDYMNVDPHLGGNGALQHLCKDVHARGMRIILDAVLNHTSVHHHWFDKYGDAIKHVPSGAVTTATRAPVATSPRPPHSHSKVTAGSHDAAVDTAHTHDGGGDGGGTNSGRGDPDADADDADGDGGRDGDGGTLARSTGAFQNPTSPFRDFYFFLHRRHRRTRRHDDTSSEGGGEQEEGTSGEARAVVDTEADEVLEAEEVVVEGGADMGKGDDYVAWLGYDSLPKLNLANPQVRAYLYAEERAVIRHWLRPPYAIDGWRFDVIHMLGEGANATNNAFYVRQFRQATKETNPQAYVLGEHFYEATQWLQGDQEDGCMAYYTFLHPMRAFFAGTDLIGDPIHLDASELSSWLCESRAKIPWENQLALFNQLDSHDTPRMLTLLGGDVAKLKAAATVLFAYPGTPCIYYGDEVGVEGGKDPDCRRCFPWNRQEWRQDLFAHYQRLVAVRKATPALQYGAYVPLYAHGDVFAFARWLAGTVVICVAVRSGGTIATTASTAEEGQRAAAIVLPVWKCGLDEGAVLTNVLAGHATNADDDADDDDADDDSSGSFVVSRGGWLDITSSTSTFTSMSTSPSTIHGSALLVAKM